jgi:hypothetical protein
MPRLNDVSCSSDHEKIPIHSSIKSHQNVLDFILQRGAVCISRYICFSKQSSDLARYVSASRAVKAREIRIKKTKKNPLLPATLRESMET